MYFGSLVSVFLDFQKENSNEIIARFSLDDLCHAFQIENEFFVIGQQKSNHPCISSIGDRKSYTKNFPQSITS